MSQPVIDPAKLAKIDQKIASTNAALDILVTRIRQQLTNGADPTLVATQLLNAQMKVAERKANPDMTTPAALLTVAVMRLAQAGERPVTPPQQLDSAGLPRVISIKVEQAHGHVRVHVWIGQDGHPGKVGELVMRPEDWFDMRAALVHGYKAGVVRYRYEPGTQQWLDSIRAERQAKAGGR